MQSNEPTTSAQANPIDLSDVKAALLMAVDLGFEVVKEVVQKPVETGEEVAKKACEEGKKVVEKGVGAAKEHPLATLLIAFGLGFLVVKLLKRK
ncbi:hypothetical protein Desdi_0841 [Desulfitobacterium dichloroeliminans LMG P-21439]|uniref:Uncharacterized protein n=1 Tax=Desulfitobacterium dichloroeliminans (strain LMG P-21439 / DCA1) TaxID=871963 RepID=L0F5P3_DESDL|nr:hypothetical protein [Desulfitobacterium dichloroeliminans]AGA68365.1 hypothetical protein Desdi_0841 [Desulfitobacterium dichloroeliminans LMG P-21439]